MLLSAWEACSSREGGGWVNGYRQFTLGPRGKLESTDLALNTLGDSSLYLKTRGYDWNSSSVRAGGCEPWLPPAWMCACIGATGECMCGCGEAVDVTWHLCKEESGGECQGRNVHPSVAIGNHSCVAASTSCSFHSRWQGLSTPLRRMYLHKSPFHCYSL